MCLDGMERIGKIQGKKCDIILKYADDEVRNLRTIGEIVENTTKENQADDIDWATGDDTVTLDDI